MKKIIIPLRVISSLGEIGMRELLEDNGFRLEEEIQVSHDLYENKFTYTQEGE